MYWSSNTAAFVTSAAPSSSRTRCSVSSLARTFVPGKKWTTEAKPWAMVSADDGRRGSGEAAPVRRSTRSPAAPRPFMAHSTSAWPILLVGSSVIGDFDVAEAGGRAAVGRKAGKRPRRPLVVHEAARAVDRIDDEADERFFFAGAIGKNVHAFRED